MFVVWVFSCKFICQLISAYRNMTRELNVEDVKYFSKDKIDFKLSEIAHCGRITTTLF